MPEKLKGADLKEALESAEAELVTVLKRAEMLKEWIEVTKRLCAKNSKSSPEPSNTFRVYLRPRRTKTAELAVQILEVLQERGSPMHVKDIATALAEKGRPMTAKNPEATIAIALGRRPTQFLKTAPNTFGLVSAPIESTVDMTR